jgi:hypothetical protein
LGEAVAVWPEVGLGSRVAEGLGISVAEGVSARSLVTCAHTVEATSVLCAFRSTVGALVGVAAPPQADTSSKTRPTPITVIIFIVFDI